MHRLFCSEQCITLLHPPQQDGVFQHCEVLAGNKYHVSWTIEGDSIAVQLQGMAEPNTYLGFGISGSDTRTLMIGADITAVWIDRDSNQGRVDDYYLSAYGQVSVSILFCQLWFDIGKRLIVVLVGITEETVPISRKQSSDKCVTFVKLEVIVCD